MRDDRSERGARLSLRVQAGRLRQEPDLQLHERVPAPVPMQRTGFDHAYLYLPDLLNTHWQSGRVRSFVLLECAIDEQRAKGRHV